MKLLVTKFLKVFMLIIPTAVCAVEPIDIYTLGWGESIGYDVTGVLNELKLTKDEAVFQEFVQRNMQGQSFQVYVLLASDGLSKEQRNNMNKSLGEYDFMTDIVDVKEKCVELGWQKTRCANTYKSFMKKKKNYFSTHKKEVKIKNDAASKKERNLGY